MLYSFINTGNEFKQRFFIMYILPSTETVTLTVRRQQQTFSNETQSTVRRSRACRGQSSFTLTYPTPASGLTYTNTNLSNFTLTTLPKLQLYYATFPKPMKQRLFMKNSFFRLHAS